MTASPTTPVRVRGRRLTPLLVDMSGWRALVVGGGPVGARRAATLADAGASVHVVSPEVTSSIEELAESGRVQVSRRPYVESDLAQQDLVVAATGDPEVDAEVRAGSARAGILCNVAASAEDCDVVFPSTVRRGPLVVALSTGGASPALAARARGLVENALGPEWAELAELLDEARDALRARHPDPAARRAAVDRLLDGDVLALLASGRRDDARRLVGETLGVA